MQETRIDLDAEAVWVENRWWHRDELISAIQARVKAGNFSVEPLNAALHKLDAALKDARIISLRVEGQLLDQLWDIAQRHGVSPGVLLRFGAREVVARANAARPPTPAATPAPIKPAQIQPSVRLVTEPARPEERARAIPLRPTASSAIARPIPAAPRRAANDEEELENRWFQAGESQHG